MQEVGNVGGTTFFRLLLVANPYQRASGNGEDGSAMNCEMTGSVKPILLEMKHAKEQG